MTSYRLTRAAELDLREALEYVAEHDGADRALHVHDAFVELFESIAAMPEAGFRRPKLIGDHVRWRAVFKWLVIYDPDASPTLILRVVHGARELGALWEDAP